MRGEMDEVAGLALAACGYGFDPIRGECPRLMCLI